MSDGLRYWQKTYIHPNIALQCLFQFMVLAIGTFGSVFWCGFWPSSHCTDGAEYPLFLLFTIAFPLGVVVLSIAESLTDLLNARSMFLYETVKTMLATATYAFAWHFQQFREMTEVVVASTIVLAQSVFYYFAFIYASTEYYVELGRENEVCVRDIEEDADELVPSGTTGVAPTERSPLLASR